MKEKILQTIIVLFLFISFVSCDCNQNVSGNVFDQETKLPLKEVRVQKINKDYGEEETDDMGFFELRFIDGGLCGCPAMKISLIKTGYLEKKVEIENGRHLNIYLKKLN